MAEPTEPLSEIHRKNMDAAIRLAQLSVSNSQQIMQLQAELAKRLFDDSAANAHALADVKDPQQLVALRTQFAQDTARHMMAAAQQIAEIGNQARQEFSRLLTEQLASGSQELMESLQVFLKSLPGQNPGAMETMQHAMAAATSAFAEMAKASGSAFSGAPGSNSKKQ